MKDPVRKFSSRYGASHSPSFANDDHRHELLAIVATRTAKPASDVLSVFVLSFFRDLLWDCWLLLLLPLLASTQPIPIATFLWAQHIHENKGPNTLS